MLQALVDQLKELSESSTEEFRESLEARMGGKVTEEQLRALKEFIFLLPPALRQLSGYWGDERTPAKLKELSGPIIYYLYHSDDLISDKKHGLFGFLDDAYVVVSAFLKIQDMYLRDWQDKSEEELDLLKRARELIVVPQIVIPEEVARIDKMIDSFMSGEATNMEELFRAAR